MDKQAISDIIYNHILANKQSLIKQFSDSEKTIGYFYIDNVLPEELALECAKVFPKPEEMKMLKSIKEHKHVSAQMNKHDKLLEAVIYAFQNNKVVKLIGEICNISSLYPDDSLYAGGLSLMAKDNFLNPHLDNSHDAERERWRVLNLLYYVTPDWEQQNGGHLELWPNGPKKEAVELQSRFNRLIVMATHSKSWHSVNKVTVDGSRCCISNYYFSNIALRETDKFHVTKFRGRPNQTLTNLFLDCDSSLRMLVRKVFKKGVRKNPHIYNKPKK
ncbi:2OG-Fe(II) oxygenase [Lacinutrix sp. Bg11-31]|uniref:2OG-Fe(II) oxygenase n=1 Tax=Lacinutrix sp. Bg11-31 TaxID=2057808 RepID=UPI000C30F9F0|nr:2OG-Fe(II) oxygenase [Lacinutrix sp. Bg11-31]AUC83619.1 2OG-Fe(II) oxygenase [Lacinutrix sp. Bg11-31]